MIGAARSVLTKCVALLLRVKSRSQDEAGFTLVEVIVALTMMSAALTLVLSMISNGLARVASARQMAEAGSVAQSVMARVGTELPVAPGERDGKSSNGYRWRLSLLPYENTRAAGDGPLALYEVTAEVEWDDHGAKRAYRLTSLRLGPKAASQ